MAAAPTLWRTGVILTASGIGAGAFGAHSLASRLQAVKNGPTNWSMASNYAIVNGIALLAISQHPRHGRRIGGPLIAVGTLVFSGSIFALLLFRDKTFVSKTAGPATPLGGLAMIAGYLSLLL